MSGCGPLREGGFRVERELIEGNNGAVTQVVHNNGHADAGYQTSAGCAMKVVELVREALQEPGKAKL